MPTHTGGMHNMKKENENGKLTYTRPWLELIWLEAEDVITDSPQGIETPIDPFISEP